MRQTSMRKKIRHIVLLFLLLLTALPAAALTVRPGAAVSAQEAADGSIRVGFFAFSGYHVEDDAGERSGYGYDFFQKIGNYMDCTFDYVGYDLSYSDCLEMLERGELDVVTSVTRTPEREEKFLFSRKSIGTNSTILTVKAGNDSVIAGDYDTYDGLTVGMLDGNSKNDNFRAFEKENGFSCEEVFYETEDELTDALQAGEVDAAVTGSLRVVSNEWILESFAASDFYVCVNRENPGLMGQIDAAIDQLDLDEPDWRTALHRQYYSEDSGGLVLLSAQERAYFEKLSEDHVILRAIVNPDRRPYSYFEDGEAKGILPELFMEAAEKLGLSCEILEAGSREEYHEMRESGTADIVLDFDDSYYRAECAGYRITDSYVEAGLTRLMRSRGYTGDGPVAVPKYSEIEYSYEKSAFGDEPAMYCDSVEDCVEAVLDETADSAVLFTYTVERILQEDIRNRMTFMVLEDAPVFYTLGVNVRDSYLLRSALNKALAGISEEERAALILRETRQALPEGGQALLSFLYSNPAYGVLAVLVLCALVFLAALLVIRSRAQRQLQIRTDDISAKYEAQKLELHEALQKAETASKSKSIFLFNMSHDIRTPMNAIIGFADMAEKHLGEPEVVGNAVRKIKTSSNILLDLINNVLDLARIESGRTVLETAPHDILENERRIENLFAENMKKAELRFVTEYDVRDRYVLYDSLRMNQISINLLGNAVKFTPAGGTVTYSIRQLGGAEDGYAVYQLSVKDTGIGMSEEFQKRVFDQFERERSSTVSGVQGTGLGMAIVKRIVEMMDGTIEVHSSPGKGTQFLVTLRFRVADEETVRRKYGEVPQEVDFSGCRVLLVEDNELNREIASALLQEEGFEVDVAEDGTVAVDRVAHSGSARYDVVLMDIQMPVMDGYQATREIRGLEDKELANIPIIAMTANAFEEDRKMAYEAGMNGHLSKPIDTRKMLETLQEILKKRRDASDARKDI